MASSVKMEFSSRNHLLGLTVLAFHLVGAVPTPLTFGGGSLSCPSLPPTDFSMVPPPPPPPLMVSPPQAALMGVGREPLNPVSDQMITLYHHDVINELDLSLDATINWPQRTQLHWGRGGFIFWSEEAEAVRYACRIQKKEEVSVTRVKWNGLGARTLDFSGENRRYLEGYKAYVEACGEKEKETWYEWQHKYCDLISGPAPIDFGEGHEVKSTAWQLVMLGHKAALERVTKVESYKIKCTEVAVDL